MKVLERAKLFCNKKKCKFFLLKLDFLGRHISARGIKLNASKVQRILDWPTPQNSTDVREFLGLVRYLASFLPVLVEQTCILTHHKGSLIEFRLDALHQAAFEDIKKLVVGSYGSRATEDWNIIIFPTLSNKVARP